MRGFSNPQTESLSDLSSMVIVVLESRSLGIAGAGLGLESKESESGQEEMSKQHV